MTCGRIACACDGSCRPGIPAASSPSLTLPVTDRQRILNDFREFVSRTACMTATENTIMAEGYRLWGQLAMADYECRLLNDRVKALEARILAEGDPHVQLTSTERKEA